MFIYKRHLSNRDYIIECCIKFQPVYGYNRNMGYLKTGLRGQVLVHTEYIYIFDYQQVKYDTLEMYSAAIYIQQHGFGEISSLSFPHKKKKSANTNMVKQNPMCCFSTQHIESSGVEGKLVWRLQWELWTTCSCHSLLVKVLIIGKSCTFWQSHWKDDLSRSITSV